MRAIALLLVAACGGQPALANAPHPDPAAVAGGAAAAAAAITLVDPNAATRGKPEKPKDDTEKTPVEVKESVPADVFDRLDRNPGTGSEAGSGSVAPASAKPAKKRKGPPPKIPSPRDAAAKHAD